MNKNNNNEFLYCRVLAKRQSSFPEGDLLSALMSQMEPQLEVKDGGELSTYQMALIKSDVIGFSEMMGDLIPEKDKGKYSMIRLKGDQASYGINVPFDMLKEIMEDYYAKK